MTSFRISVSVIGNTLVRYARWQITLYYSIITPKKECLNKFRTWYLLFMNLCYYVATLNTTRTYNFVFLSFLHIFVR